jgi:hypothetical protein
VITSATNIQTITYTAGASGNVGLTLVVTNAQGCSTQNSVNVPINATPAFTPAAGALSVATFNVAYSLTFAGTVGTAPFTFALASGALPTGMTLNSNGTVSPNTPTATGAFSFSITVTDANGCSSTQAYTLNVQPNLQTDAYSGVGNTQLFITGVAGAPTTPAVSSATTVLANDTPGGIAITAGTTACGGIGGSITMDTAGRFIYTPPVGLTGIATCTYTGTSNTIAATGTINITLTGMVWYVNNTIGVSGDGRSHNPFKLLSDAQGPGVGKPQTGQTIYVHTGSGATTGNLNLLASQVLVGNGVAFTIGPLSLSAGTKPILSGTVALANDVSVSGLQFNPAGSGSAITGTSVTGTSTISQNTIALSNSGTAVSLTGGAGTINFTSTSISQSGAGTGISIGSKTGGTVSFDSASPVSVTGAGATGVSLTSNTGVTITFAGGLTLTTTTGNAFTATGGGTVTATQNNTSIVNTLTTTTGTALNVANTTIGAAGLTFRSIAANGATNGINLSATGSSGGLTVTGNGSADSGGIIQNTSGSGIVASDTQNLSLTRIKILNAATHGIDASNLRGTCLLSTSTIQDWVSAIGNGLNLINNNANLTLLTITGTTFNGTATDNAGVLMEAQGTSNMTLSVEGGSVFTDMFGDAIHAGTITGASGTINVTVKNSTFNNAAAVGNGGILMTPFGGPSNFTFNIDSNTFDDIMRPVTNLGAISVTNGDLDGGGPTMNGTIQHNTINNLPGSRGITVTCDTFSGPTTLLFDDNSIDRLGSTSKHGISVNFVNNATGKVTVTNNRIGQAGCPGACVNLWTSGGGTGNGVLLLTQNSASMTALLSGNQVRANTTSVIEVMRVRAINSSTMNATVTGNDLVDTDTATAHVEFDATTATTGPVALCLNISGNTVPAGGAGVIKLSESVESLNVVQASAAAVAAANNAATVTVSGSPTFGVAACPTP